MNIGQAAAESGVSAKMIRHYEAIGLIGAAERSESRYRHFSAPDVHGLRFIKRARTLGFSIKDIGVLLGLWRGQRPSAEVKRLALAHIAALDAKIAEMQGMRDALGRLARECHGDARPACPILEELAGEGGVPIDSVWDDFFAAPGVVLGQRQQPEALDREAL